MRTRPWDGQFRVLEKHSVARMSVSWNECVAFCERLTDSERQSGKLSSSEEYRLPTEAEWEYACLPERRLPTVLGQTLHYFLIMHGSRANRNNSSG